MNIFVPGTSGLTGLSNNLIIVLPSTTPTTPISSPMEYLNLCGSASNAPLQVQATQQLTLSSNIVLDQLNLIQPNLNLAALNSNYLSGVNNQQHIQLPLATQPVLVPSALNMPDPLQNVQLSIFPELSNLPLFDLNTDSISSSVSVPSASGLRPSLSNQGMSSILDREVEIMESLPKTMPAAVRECVRDDHVCEDHVREDHVRAPSHSVEGEVTSESAQRIFMRSAGDFGGSRPNTLTVPTAPNQLSSSPQSDSINDSNSNSSTISNGSKLRNSSSASTIVTATNSDQDELGPRGTSSGFACPHCNARYAYMGYMK